MWNAQVRHRDMGIYARVRAMIANPAKRAHVFTNEHFSGTFIETRAGESPNDRNDRAIRTAAQWYGEGQKHFTSEIRRCNRCPLPHITFFRSALAPLIIRCNANASIVLITREWKSC